MTGRHLGLIGVGVFMLLGSLLLLAEGDVGIGAAGVLFALVLFVVPAAELLPDGSGPRVEDGALVIRINRTRLVLLAVAAVLFAAVGVLFASTAENLSGRVIGVLAVLVFGAAAVIRSWQLRGPWRLVLTPQALRWDQGGAGRPVAWDDVTRVGMLTIRGVKTMTIDVERAHGGLLAGLNRRFGGGDVNVPLNQASVDDELLLSLVTVCAREPQARETLVTEATARRLEA